MDTREEIKAKLADIFEDVFDDEIELLDEMTAEDILEWDSVTHIVLVIAIEKAFNVNLNAADVGHLKNVGEMITLLERHHT